MNSIQKKIESIVQMINSLPSSVSHSQVYSSPQCKNMLLFTYLANSTTLNLYINPSSTSPSLQQTIETVSKDMLSIEEHVFTLVNGFNHLSISFTDRLQSIEFSLSQLLLRSQSLSRSFEKITASYKSILNNSTYLYRNQNHKAMSVSQVAEKVIEIEPLLSLAAGLKKKMDELMLLASSIQSVESRVKRLEEQQEELNTLVENSLNRVKSVCF